MTEQDFKRACLARVDLYRHLRDRKIKLHEDTREQLGSIQRKYASLADVREMFKVARQRVARMRSLVLQ